MSTDITPPRADSKVSGEDGKTSYEHQLFFEEISDHINELRDTNTGVTPPIVDEDGAQRWTDILVPSSESIVVFTSIRTGRYINSILSNVSINTGDHVGYRVSSGVTTGTSITKNITDINGTLTGIRTTVTFVPGNIFSITITNNTATDILSSGLANVI